MKRPHKIILAICCTVMVVSSLLIGFWIWGNGQMERMHNHGKSLVGKWRQIAPTDGSLSESVTMDFSPDGSLVYSIDTNEKTQTINLVYETLGDKLITDQPSAPKKEATKYYFESENLLVLDYDGEETRFRRVE